MVCQKQLCLDTAPPHPASCGAFSALWAGIFFQAEGARAPLSCSRRPHHRPRLFAYARCRYKEHGSGGNARWPMPHAADGRSQPLVAALSLYRVEGPTARRRRDSNVVNPLLFTKARDGLGFLSAAISVRASLDRRVVALALRNGDIPSPSEPVSSQLWGWELIAIAIPLDPFFPAAAPVAGDSASRTSFRDMSVLFSQVEKPPLVPSLPSPGVDVPGRVPPPPQSGLESVRGVTDLPDRGAGRHPVAKSSATSTPGATLGTHQDRGPTCPKAGPCRPCLFHALAASTRCAARCPVSFWQGSAISKRRSPKIV